jgi:hypothetical protein
MKDLVQWKTKRRLHMEKKLIRSFEDLIVWQKAIEFVTQVYRVTNQGELKRDFGLRDQMRRAAVSIPTNIAEGFERASRKGVSALLEHREGICRRD